MTITTKVFLLFLHIVLATATASSSPSVIIIGAGISGISAAKTLHEAGIRNFLILEATNRTGGRIHKGQFAGHTIELGANWLLSGGPKNYPLDDIANKLKLKTFYSDYKNISSNIYKQEGGLYAKNVVESELETADATSEFCTNLSRITTRKYLFYDRYL